MKTFLISTAAIAILATSVSAAGTPGAGFLDSWDGDANGAVTLAEIAEKRENIFFTFDENGDGSLTAEEYVAFDEARAADQASEGHGNKGGGHGQGAVGMTLEFNDVDGSGDVSMAEFIGQSEAWFAMMDRNGDGEVTSADFGRQ
ncbi:MAG: EF-hand domain-containing protein [Rhodobacteraceae bacterium]|nr:EF-hand domain-containing protein [Paracoccaceae bacterium]